MPHTADQLKRAIVTGNADLVQLILNERRNGTPTVDVNNLPDDNGNDNPNNPGRNAFFSR